MMAARSTRGIQWWRWACPAALALLAGCQSKSASVAGPAESMGAPVAQSPPAEPEATGAPAQPAEPEKVADEAKDGPPVPASHDLDQPAGATAPPEAATVTARPAPPPPPRPTRPSASAPAPAPAPERPRSPAGDTGPARVKHPAHAGTGTSQQRRKPMIPDVEVTGSEAVTRQEGRDQDRPNQAREAHATKNAGEPDATVATVATVEEILQNLPQSVEAFYASLPEQAIAFHVPRSVQRGEMFAVRLVVQPGQSEAALEAALVDIVTDAGPAPAPGDIRTRTTRVGDEMQASISSPTLQIVPRGENRQLVRRGAVTEWVWDVTANRGGSHRLTLGLYAIPPGRGSGVKVKTFEETLTVNVTFFDEVRDTVANNWEWMWTFVLGPLGALAWRRRQRRHAQAA
jgi:hypothetical protein